VLTTHSILTPRSQIRLPPSPLWSCTGSSWRGLTSSIETNSNVSSKTCVCAVFESCSAGVHSAVLNCLCPFQVNLKRDKKYFFLFCTMTNKCTIISQIITLVHVSTLSCHPQGACNHYLAQLYSYFHCSCW
jgi:hypothetical protein